MQGELFTKKGFVTSRHAACGSVAGSYAMIDPHNHISTFFAMHAKNHRYLYRVVHPSIRRLIYKAIL